MDNNTMGMLLYFGVFILIIYFLFIRPQRKQQRERMYMLENLRVRDKIVTIGGIHGKITKIKEDTVVIQIADKVEIEIEKAAVARVTNREITMDNNKKTKKNEKTEKPDKAEKTAKADQAQKAEAEEQNQVDQELETNEPSDKDKNA